MQYHHDGYRHADSAMALARGLGWFSIGLGVAELVAHVNWWNRWMLDVIEEGRAMPYPKHASDTWPSVTEDDWARVRGEFYELLARVDTHTARPDLANPVNHEETIGELLADFALHTAHHFGQVVTVRPGRWL